MAQVKERRWGGEETLTLTFPSFPSPSLLLHFLALISFLARPKPVFLCSETKWKRLLRRLIHGALGRSRRQWRRRTEIKKPTWPMAEQQNWTWLPEVGFSPCRALVGVLPLKNLPICSGNLPPHPHLWFCLLSTRLYYWSVHIPISDHIPHLYRNRKYLPTFIFCFCRRR